MAQYSDEQIVEAIKTGGIALERVMAFVYNNTDFRTDIIRYIKSKGGTSEDAEDVFQDGIRNLIMSVRKNKFRGESTIKGYLFGVCRNIWFKQFNRHVRSEQYKSSLEVESTDRKDPEIVLVTEERAQLIDQILAKLGPACQKVLNLWRLSYSMKEIAQELGYKSDGVARKKKHQCFQGLLGLVKDNPAIVNLLKEAP
ncbi:MAG: sigma-70 family RNA polymerase sigma factor [Bacteroidota bacterium]